MDFIGDIVERTEIVEAKPPEAPAAAPSRAPSKWKSRKQAEQSLARDIGAGIDKTGENFDNHSDFERENLQRVQTMSPEEVEEAKSELLAMDPKLLDVLAKRAKKQEMESQTGQTERQTKLQTGQTERQPELKNEVQTEHQAEHQAGPQPERQLDHQTGRQEPQEPRAIHFPKAPPLQLQDLAPDQLHEKFYPDLETEPEKMAWMQPLDDDKEAYSNLESVASTELRFDFAGDIISPRQSSAVPTHLGLHHHGDQPAAAGYTIPELAHLARSTVASQRSLAIRTLGRVVYKLGNGRFGSEIGAQLWALVDQFQVKEALVLAESQSSSVSVQAYAQEALWLMQQSKNRRPAV